MNNNNNNTKEIFRVDVESGQKFRSIIDGDLRLMSSISAYASNFLHAIFKDLDGVVLAVDKTTPMPTIRVKAYFSDKVNIEARSGATVAFTVNEDIRMSNARTITDRVDRFERFRSMDQTRKYSITDDAKEVLAKYIDTGNPSLRITPENASDPKFDKFWDSIIFEETSRNTLNQYSKLVYVTNININLMLSDIFGRYQEVPDSEDGKKVKKEPVQYSITPLRPIGDGNDVTSNWLVRIDRINLANLDKVNAEVGFVPSNNGIPGLVAPTN